MEVRAMDSALKLCFPPGILSFSGSPVLPLLYLLQAHSLPLLRRRLAGALHLVTTAMKALTACWLPGEGTFTK